MRYETECGNTSPSAAGPESENWKQEAREFRPRCSCNGRASRGSVAAKITFDNEGGETALDVRPKHLSWPPVFLLATERAETLLASQNLAHWLLSRLFRNAA